MTVAVSMIVALDRNRAIGRGNAMPWHLSDDLKRFKRLTLGKPILMGHNTARAIGLALPGRPNLVLSRHRDAPFPGQHAVRSLDEALALAGDRELMVIGGGEVYRLALPWAQTLHLTRVNTQIEGADTWFPEFDLDEWQELSREHHAADARNEHDFEWIDYTRLSQ